MKNILRIAASLMALVIFTSSAGAAKCVPLPPKDLAGTIAIVPFVRHSMTANYFLDNGCDWAGNEDLNGVDAWVFDMTGIEGKAVLTVIAGPVGLASPYEATTLTEGCETNGDVMTVGSSGADFPQPTLVTIPPATKWMIVQGSTVKQVAEQFATDVNVTVEFEGKACPTKKKKKR